jgi:ribose transport system ATP-binding protein
MGSTQAFEDREVIVPALRIEGLSKSFAGVRALDNVSLDVFPREVVGVIGENGSGKSTLLKIIAGILRPDSGRIAAHGQSVTLTNAAAAAASGIAMVFQEQALLQNVTVAENILLGQEKRITHAGLYDWRALYALAAVQLDKVQARISPSAVTSTLSFRERQLVEIARALAVEDLAHREPTILLDEPTSMLDATGTNAVLGLVERLRGGASVVFTSHRLDEVLRVSDRICILAKGRCVAMRDRTNCSTAELRGLMLGRQPDEECGHDASWSRHESEVRLSVRALSCRNSLKDVAFDLHSGEVLGIAELSGTSGESLSRILFGADKSDSGEIALDGQLLRLRTPADAVRHGIGYVAGERQVDGLIGGLGVCENMTLAHLDEFRRGPFIDRAAELDVVKRWIARMGIKATATMPARDLSGGNQQKVVLAKWLIGSKLRVLVLNRPMRGLDVGARAEMSALIREFARAGVGVLLVSDTIDEVMTLSNSIIVLKDGIVAGRFPASAPKPSRMQILEKIV